MTKDVTINLDGDKYNFLVEFPSDMGDTEIENVLVHARRVKIHKETQTFYVLGD